VTLRSVDFISASPAFAACILSILSCLRALQKE